MSLDNCGGHKLIEEVVNTLSAINTELHALLKNSTVLTQLCDYFVLKKSKPNGVGCGRGKG